MEKNAYNSEWEWLLVSKDGKPDEALVIIKGCEPKEGETIIAKAVNLTAAQAIVEEHNQAIKLQPGEMPSLTAEKFQSEEYMRHSLAWALKAFRSILETSDDSPLAALRDAIGLESAVWILFGHESKLGSWLGAQKMILARKAGRMFAGQ